MGLVKIRVDNDWLKVAGVKGDIGPIGPTGPTGPAGTPFPYTGSAEISGSLTVQGPIAADTFIGDGSQLTGLEGADEYARTLAILGL
jgi:hypothetical protein